MRLRFSDKMHDVLGFTAEEALRTGWRAAGVDHLMLGLLRHRDNDACRALTESGIDPGDLKRSLDEHLFRPEPLNFGEPEDYDRMKKSYDEQKAQLSMATGYTDWGEDNG